MANNAVLEIQNILDNPIFLELENIRENIRNIWDPEIPVWNTRINSGEIIEKIRIIIGLLSESIKNDSLESIPLLKLSSLRDYMNNLVSYLTQFRDNPHQNYLTNVVNGTETIHSFVFDLGLIFAKNPKTSSERKRLNEIIAEYQKLKESLSKAKNMLDSVWDEYKTAQEKRKYIEEIEEKSKESELKINEYKTQIDTSVKEVESRKQESQLVEGRINEIRWNAEEFIGKINTKELEFQDLKRQSEELLIKNQEQSSQITTLLWKAASASRFQYFDWKRAFYELRENDYYSYWKRSTLLLIIVASGVWFWTVIDLIWKWGEVDKNFLTVTILKFLILAPLLYFVHFFSKQYSRSQYLAEWYGFKSVVSLSLPDYQTLLSETTDEKVKDITKSTMEKVFSPVEPIKVTGGEKSSIAEKDIDLLWKIADLAGRIK